MAETFWISSRARRGGAKRRGENDDRASHPHLPRARAEDRHLRPGPSDYPEFAQFLIEQGIDSISLNPDTVLKTTLAIVEKEKALGVLPT